MNAFKEFAEDVLNLINPYSNRYSIYQKLIGFSGTCMFLSWPGIVKNIIKSIEMVVCDSVNEGHQEICHNHFKEANFYINIASYSSATIGELFLMSKILEIY